MISRLDDSTVGQAGAPTGASGVSRPVGELSPTHLHFQTWLEAQGMGAPSQVPADVRTFASLDRIHPEDIGKALRRFHALGQRYAKASGLAAEARAKAVSSQDVERYSATLNSETWKKQLAALAERVETLQEESARRAIPLHAPVVHGSFDPSKLLDMDGGPRMSGLESARPGHPAVDLADALAAMMVLRSHDPSIKMGAVPGTVSPLARRIGQEFLNGYFGCDHTHAEVSALFTGLKQEIPRAVEQGVLAGLVDGRFTSNSLPVTAERLKAIESELATFLDEARVQVKARKSESHHEVSLFESPMAGASGMAPPGVMNGYRRGLYILTPEYWVEHLDEEHLRWDRHEPLVRLWQETEPSRDYFKWLADHRANGGRAEDDIYTAYLKDTPAQLEARATFEMGRDGKTRLRPLTGDAAWVERVESADGPTQLLYTGNPDNSGLEVYFKEETPDGHVYHTSGRNAEPVPVAGYMPVHPDRTVDLIWSESGHYKDKVRGMHDFVLGLARRQQINPDQLRVKAFQTPEMTAAEMINMGPPGLTPIKLRPPEDWLDPVRRIWF
jgi:hypothetical protein